MRRKLAPVLLGLIGLVLFFVLLYYFTRLVEPASLVQNLLVTNVTDHQTTLSWTTQKPTKGLVVVSEDGKFPILPMFAQKTYQDDGEKNSRRQGFYTTHHITVGELQPQKTYQYLIYQGWKKAYRGSFVTGPTLNSISAPNPVYGKVLDSDKKTGVAGAIIYFQATASAMLSTLTNAEGGWSVDLGNLRTQDLEMSYQLSTKSAEMVVVETGVRGKFKATTVFGKDKPWPDIILK